MPHSRRFTRRDLLRSGAAAAAAFTIVPRRVLGGHGYIAPSDKLTKAVIGVGGMGRGHLSYDGPGPAGRLRRRCGPPRPRPWRSAGPRRRGLSRLSRGPGPARYRHRPHRHAARTGTALIAIAAAEAGKDVWCEKPMTRTIGEGRTARRGRPAHRPDLPHQHLVPLHRPLLRLRDDGQAHQKGRPGGPARLAAQGHRQRHDRLRLEVLLERPNLSPARAGAARSSTTTSGSARRPVKPYHPHRVHHTFRGYWDYDGGGLGDMGMHYLDPVQYLLDKDDTSPVEIDADCAPAAPGRLRRLAPGRDEVRRRLRDRPRRREPGHLGAPFLEGPKGKLYRGFESDIPDLAAKSSPPCPIPSRSSRTSASPSGRGSPSP